MEVSDQIIKVLDNLGQKFGLAIDWIKDNIAPYIQELGKRIVNYEMWTSVVWIVVFLIGIGLLYLLLRKIIKMKDNFANDDYYALYLLTIAGMIGFGILITFQVIDIVTCLTLPEKVWIEYIQKYIQNKITLKS